MPSAGHASPPRGCRGPLSGRDPDRQSRRHHDARAGDAGRRRPDRLRGHPRHPQADSSATRSRPRLRPTTTTTPRRRGRKCWNSWRQGASVALVSDAGTPLISDPGFKLVREVCAAGIAVTALPGASSVLAALVVAGAADRPFFLRGLFAVEAGRAPHAHCRAGADRRDAGAVRIRDRASQDRLHDLAAGLGERDAAVCREMTKLHEEVMRGAARRTRARRAANWRRAANSSS